MPNKRQRANRRLASTRAVVTALPHDVDRESRVSRVGFDELYEIIRSGEVFSRRDRRFIKHKFSDGRAYIEFQVNGQKHQRNIADAAQESWARAVPRLFRVEVPATTLVVLAHDEREAVTVAGRGMAKEIVEGRTPVATVSITSRDQVPVGWDGGCPYGPGSVDTTDRTVAERLRAMPPRPASSEASVGGHVKAPELQRRPGARAQRDSKARSG